MFSTILKAIISFIPNVVKAYTDKPVQNTSEGAGALVLGLGWLLSTLHVVDTTHFTSFVAPLLTYIIMRFVSKGVAPAA